MKITILNLLFTFSLIASENNFEGGSRLDFEALLIEGQLKRAEVSAVTGDLDNQVEGLIRYREDFLDKMAMELGEEIP